MEEQPIKLGSVCLLQKTPGSLGWHPFFTPAPLPEAISQGAGERNLHMRPMFSGQQTETQQARGVA